MFEFERNLKYYKSNNKSFYTGVVILAVGAVLFALDRILYLWYPLTMCGVVMAIAGSICAFVPGWSRSSDKDINEQINARFNGYLDEKIKSLGVRNFLSGNIESLIISGYDFRAEGSLVRLGLDGNYRGSEYAGAAFIFTTTSVIICENRFSLIADKTSEQTTEFLYADLDRAEFADDPFVVGEGEDAVTVKHSSFRLYAGNGLVYSLPSSPNAKAEDAARDLNMMIARAKNK